jgi:hypothetical protein
MPERVDKFSLWQLTMSSENTDPPTNWVGYSLLCAKIDNSQGFSIMGVALRTDSGLPDNPV